MASAAACSQIRSARALGSLSFLRNFSSNQRPLILAALRPERGGYLPVGLGLEAPNGGLALRHDGQGGGLHPAHGGFVESPGLGVERGHGPGAVDAHQPVGLRAAQGGIRQRQHLRVLAKLDESVPDGGRGHGLEPEPLDGFLGLGVADDVAEDELAFPSGVAGVDQGVHVLALHQLDQQLEPGGGLLDGFEIEVGWYHRQIGEAPLAARRLHSLRRSLLQQMPHRRRQHVLVALVVVLVPFEAAQRPGHVRGHRRLLRDDQCLAHVVVSNPLSRTRKAREVPASAPSMRPA